MDQMKRDARMKKKETTHRTWSVPSLNEDDLGLGCRGISISGCDFLGMPSLSDTISDKRHELQRKEIKDLKDTIKILKLQNFTQERMKLDVEKNIEKIKIDNATLLNKSKDLEKELERQKELYKHAMEASKKEVQKSYCKDCPSRTTSITGSDIGDSDLLEHDIDDLPRKQIVRLKCGGSAYGSRESLNQIGLEAVTSTLEICSDILVDAVQRNPSTAGTPSPGETPTTELPDPDNTLLGELEEQYRRLVKKYESLIDVKNKRAHAQDNSTQDARTCPSSSHATTQSDEPVKLRRRPKSMAISREVQTAWRKSSCGLDFTSPVDPVEGCFQKGPPEYKRLFKEIFETLKKSAEFEDIQK